MNTANRVLAILALGYAPMAAADVLPRFEVTPYVGYRGGGSWLDAMGDTDVEYGASFGLVLNYRATYKTQWELVYGHHGADFEFSDGSTEGVDFDFVQVGGTYVFRQQRLSPFLSLTIGATRITPDDGDVSDETYFSGTFGLGLRYEITPALGLRVEGRASGLFGKSNSLVFCDTGLGDEVCFLAGDGGVIPQFEVLTGLSLRF